MVPAPALVHGPTDPVLWHKTLGDLIDEQASRYGTKGAVIVPWQSVRLTYSQLAEKSRVLPQNILNMGLHPGDCVGIMARNRYQYTEVFLGAGRIGCPVVVLNNTYIPHELTRAVRQSSCKLVFISFSIGKQALTGHVDALRGSQSSNPELPELRRMVLLGEELPGQEGVKVHTGQTEIVRTISSEDILNLWFTSVSALYHGSSIVFPSDFFDVKQIVDTILIEDATVILGVPTMCIAELEVLAQLGRKPRRLRTGLASGSSVSQDLMNRLQEKWGSRRCRSRLSRGWMTPDEKRTSTVGRVIPHTAAKVVDRHGRILARGRGELCTSGFALQKGFWQNEQRTKEVMRRDETRVRRISFPERIEERRMAHASISEASVVGIKNERYGEVVGCFRKAIGAATKLCHDELRHDVSQTSGRHKAPQHIFWISNAAKHLLRDLGNRLARLDEVRARCG
ncbi:acetyl-CoA synthetase-like protein [Aspergillus homomorphus CBS 101889]|uniref:Acetyl-CoA synthetase-like protein n=1 Tax=Aspergillus homomorphus (strain CBS 101889) TaxID=1450537 RepID=A0A395HGV8_ASPHC|nr:acetyl-CoA synthetase-like protein [Aspergillus homomorphus CBS 101889]RAL07141.1 acetyl-CoA synthetase-like protein [Aspergillus homomorphus CBS 101889]